MKSLIYAIILSLVLVVGVEQAYADEWYVGENLQIGDIYVYDICDSALQFMEGMDNGCYNLTLTFINQIEDNGQLVWVAQSDIMYGDQNERILLIIYEGFDVKVSTLEHLDLANSIENTVFYLGDVARQEQSLDIGSNWGYAEPGSPRFGEILVRSFDGAVYEVGYVINEPSIFKIRDNVPLPIAGVLWGGLTDATSSQTFSFQIVNADLSDRMSIDINNQESLFRFLQTSDRFSRTVYVDFISNYINQSPAYPSSMSILEITQEGKERLKSVDENEISTYNEVLSTLAGEEVDAVAELRRNGVIFYNVNENVDRFAFHEIFTDNPNFLVNEIFTGGPFYEYSSVVDDVIIEEIDLIDDDLIDRDLLLSLLEEGIINEGFFGDNEEIDMPSNEEILTTVDDPFNDPFADSFDDPLSLFDETIIEDLSDVELRERERIEALLEQQLLDEINNDVFDDPFGDANTDVFDDPFNDPFDDPLNIDNYTDVFIDDFSNMENVVELSNGEIVMYYVINSFDDLTDISNDVADAITNNQQIVAFVVPEGVDSDYLLNELQKKTSSDINVRIFTDSAEDVMEEPVVVDAMEEPVVVDAMEEPAVVSAEVTDAMTKELEEIMAGESYQLVFAETEDAVLAETVQRAVNDGVLKAGEINSLLEIYEITSQGDEDLDQVRDQFIIGLNIEKYGGLVQEQIVQNVDNDAEPIREKILQLTGDVGLASAAYDAVMAGWLTMDDVNLAEIAYNHVYDASGDAELAKQSLIDVLEIREYVDEREKIDLDIFEDEDGDGIPDGIFDEEPVPEQVVEETVDDGILGEILSVFDLISSSLMGAIDGMFVPAE